MDFYLSDNIFSLFLSWCCKKQVVDLEEENLWPELLDSGKMEICISNR